MDAQAYYVFTMTFWTGKIMILHNSLASCRCGLFKEDIHTGTLHSRCSDKQMLLRQCDTEKTVKCQVSDVTTGWLLALHCNGSGEQLLLWKSV